MENLERELESAITIPGSVVSMDSTDKVIKRKKARKDRLVAYCSVLTAATISLATVGAGIYLLTTGKYVCQGAGLLSATLALWVPSPSVMLNSK